MIDVFMQSKALLAKHVVRCLFPTEELWKMLWMCHLYRFKPSVGSQWHVSLRWLFNSNCSLPKSIVGSLRFFNGNLRAWESICQALVFVPPKTINASTVVMESFIY